MIPDRRTLYAFAALIVFVTLVGVWQGPANVSLLIAHTLAYSLIALGLNIQFGYGGLFNFAIMGFLMVGGATNVFFSFPINPDFWASDGPMLLGRALLAFVAGALLVLGARRLDRFGIKGKARGIAIGIAWFVAYLVYRSQIDPAAAYIESTSGWIGGLGLYPVIGWAMAGVVVAFIARIIGKITLGLRSDYLAIATIGISEILRSFVKNMDWLTRGTLAVSPVPWPVPQPQNLQAVGVSIDDSFVYARLGFILLLAVVFVAAFVLVNRAYGGPWGRMMRAIRDNHVAAEAMGKNVRVRQLELFVLGSILMGIGGAMLVTFSQILDPSGYQPINHTFLVWVMVIVGGAGNNWGAVLGAVLIYFIWILSDPLAQFLFLNLSRWTEAIGWGAIPEIDSRSLQMRVFVLGLVISIALRYAPQGLIPEIVHKHHPELGHKKAGA
ncbi:MAG: branched-chain amino acid ABC transporter permease [Alphaproteobacteria bacterium]|nr:branched-chain amino acid ABC transporter permease [Alphaproteobacteria bacterium]